ncbi:MAG: hypothetical protein HY808_02125 [Nitrospirae bacterium]|nr:hypothetical protein [Nitrospirota bacterium]
MGKKTIKFVAIIFLLCIVYSCSWSPSDDEAVELVKNYYLFYYEGKQADAVILLRGGHIKECDCYSILFQITLPERESFKKTFYFYKSEYGKVEVSEFQPKASSR